MPPDLLRHQRRTYSQSECVDAVKQYEEYCQHTKKTVSVFGYDEWAKDQQIELPCSGTLIKKLGSWNKARVLAAGENTSDLQTRGGPRKWTDAMCVNAIRRFETFCQQTEVKPTSREYQKWQTLHSDAPSIWSIQHVAPWNEMRIRAASHEENIQLERRGSHRRSR